MIGRGNLSTRTKPAPVPLCPPQTPHAARKRTRAAAVGSQRLTAELRHGQGIVFNFSAFKGRNCCKSSCNARTDVLVLRGDLPRQKAPWICSTPLTRIRNDCEVKVKVGSCRSSAVRRWLPTAAARVHVRAACGACGGQSGTGAGFLRVLRFPLPIIPPISPLS
jgi:hypothetical protein